MANPEQAVIDEIDRLVNWQMAGGETRAEAERSVRNKLLDTCPNCEHDWHGLTCELCGCPSPHKRDGARATFEAFDELAQIQQPEEPFSWQPVVTPSSRVPVSVEYQGLIFTDLPNPLRRTITTLAAMHDFLERLWNIRV